MQWAEVSLYTKPFDEVVGAAAFDGSAIDSDFSSTSPEYSTDGGYAKCWMRENNTIKLYNAGSQLLIIEPFSEYFASQIAAVVCPDSVRYDLGVYHDQLVSKCDLFTSENKGFAKASRIFGQRKRIVDLLEYYEKLGSGDTFRRMCALDALILNPDRHYGNFGVLYDTDTMQVTKMAPVFDRNKSLFPELDEGELARPVLHCASRLGPDFVSTAKSLLTVDIRADLKNLCGFSFVQNPEFRLPDTRVNQLNKIVRTQIQQIQY